MRCALFLAVAALVLVAQDAPPSPATQPATRDATNPVVTQHTLALDGRELPYTATAGTLPIENEAGEKQADVFFVAYSSDLGEDRTARDARPITFVFNGGPGAAAVWLHLGVVGPHTLALPDDGSVPPPPYRLAPNPDTWLAFTDLVLIDPVGTGFSRAAKGVDAKQFYGLEEDIAAVGGFIRRYLTRYERWASPVFLAGESYGTTRAAGLADHLIDTQGIAVNGIVLISTVLDFATIREADNNLLPYALFLPTFTATAHHHGRLSAELQERELDDLLKEVESWTIGDYMAALARGAALPANDREAVAERLATYTGLPSSLALEANLRISPSVFQKELLDEDDLIVGRFDSRLVGRTVEPVLPFAEYDPSLSLFLPAYTSTFNSFVRSELKYESDLKYEVLSDRVRPWNFGGPGSAGNGFTDLSARLRAAMVKQPAMRVLVASGYFDLATPYLAADYTVNQLHVGDELRENIMQTYYAGGHMMYHVPAVRRQLTDDTRAFYDRTLAPAD